MNTFSKEFLYAIKKAGGVKQVVCSKNANESSNNKATWVILNDDSLWGCGYGWYGNQGESGTQFNSFTKRASNVKQVACSDCTTWYITKSGDLYGCGYGSYGQQGSNDIYVRTFTKRASNVAKVVCNEYATWYIDENGDLYGCGYGSYGQQGSGSTNNVKTFTYRASNVIDVDSSGLTTFYVTADGDLYGCGLNNNYQQGTGTTTNVSTFTQRLTGGVTEVHCFQNHTICLKNSQIYGCGTANYGQLGTPYSNKTTFSQLYSSSYGIAQLSCSPTTTWCIDKHGDLYGCGHGYNGEQSNSSTTHVYYFTKRMSNISSVVCTGVQASSGQPSGTTWCIDTSGDLYGCGNGYQGQQGNGSTSNVSSFTKRASNVIYIGANDITTFYIDTEGNLYGCGRGSAGQQGNGSTSDVTTFENKMQYIS